jgi:hypothetical protein
MLVTVTGSAVIAVGLLTSTLCGQAIDQSKNTDSTERLREMRRLAEAVRAFELTDQDRKPVDLVPESLVRYDDQPRNILDGSLWGWGRRGRPIAVMKLEVLPLPDGGLRWFGAVVSLSPSRFDLESSAGWQWSARKPGMELRPFPDAPAPADTELGRMTQMKQLVRRFSVNEDNDPKLGRTESRLLSRAIHRYADAESGLQDGAIFAFACGTNPTAILVIESRQHGSSAPTWHYGLARMTAAGLVVNLDAKEVLKLAATPLGSYDTWSCFWLPTGKAHP